MRQPLPTRDEPYPPPLPDGRVDLQLLPQGQDIPGQKGTDAISKTLAGINPGQMQDVMAAMKVRTINQDHDGFDELMRRLVRR